MDQCPKVGQVACTSMSTADVHSTDMHNISGMFTPDAPIEIKPRFGMEFATLESAYDFYNTYAWHCGFSVRKDTTRTLKTGEISRRVFRCSKAGLRDDRGRGAENRKRRASIMTRCSCPAKLCVNLKDRQQNIYCVTAFEEIHNHVLCTPTKTRRLRSHKRLTEDDLSLIKNLKASGIGVARSIDFMRADVGGPAHLGFSERDARNALRKLRWSKHGRDADTLLRFFHLKRQVDNQFFYKVQVDEDARLTSCFWTDGKSKEDYMVFNDVVCFDTTYKTNEYDMPFGPFVGVNHHKQTVLFGAGLLFGETVDDFKWLFETWLQAVGGVHPKTIITDQDAAIGAAIAEVFPDTNHILCLWHIQKKLPEKLSHIIHEHPSFKACWNRCLYGTNSADEFESNWNAMIEEFDLHNNTWLRHMFQIRHQWIPTYTNNIFSAGMRTTGRSESINAYFDGFVNHKSGLMDFANGYEKALERRRDAEEHADFQTSNGKPVLKTRYSIEAQMAGLYTFTVFLVFQKEVEESLYYIVERVKDDGVLQHWKVFQCEDHSRSNGKSISWNAVDQVAACSCKNFESTGIVCRHIITVFRAMQVIAIPPYHVLTRWTKTVKDQFKRALISGDNIITQSLAVREHGFARWVSDIRHDVVRTSEAYELFTEHMEQLRTTLAASGLNACVEPIRSEQPESGFQRTGDAGDNFNIEDPGLVNVVVAMIGNSSGVIASQSSKALAIQDPHVVKTKGRTSKRMKGPLEQPRSGAKLCRGCNKWVVGHDKRNCPFLRGIGPVDGSDDTGLISTARGRGRGRLGGPN